MKTAPAGGEDMMPVGGRVELLVGMRLGMMGGRVELVAVGNALLAENRDGVIVVDMIIGG